MRAFGRLLVQYKKDEEEGGGGNSSPARNSDAGDLSPADRKQKLLKERKVFRVEREDVANQFYERARQLLLGSDVSRMQAKMDLRKEMMKDYKYRHEKSMTQLYELKLQINVGPIFQA